MDDRELQGTLDRYLSKFERMLDRDRPRESRRRCEHAFAFEPLPELPYVLRDVSGAADADWPTFPYNDTFVHPTKMLLDQLHAPFLHHQLRDDHPLNIRCNYGTVIMPSIMGAGYRLTETSLPWTDHLSDRRAVRALIDRGLPDLSSALGGRCFETAAYYREALADYPRLRETLVIYHPDLQGPFDIAHLIWGPDIFYALYDCPDMVRELLSLVTTTYAAWMRAWKTLVGEGNDFTTHWNFYIRGGIMLRDDTSVMLCTEHYETFVRPYDQALLDEFGGCIHFCGRGNAFIASMCQSRNLYGLHSSQPELNDVALLLRSTLPNRIALLGLPVEYLPCDVQTGVIVLGHE